MRAAALIVLLCATTRAREYAKADVRAVIISVGRRASTRARAALSGRVGRNSRAAPPPLFTIVSSQRARGAAAVVQSAPRRSVASVAPKTATATRRWRPSSTTARPAATATQSAEPTSDDALRRTRMDRGVGVTPRRHRHMNCVDARWRQRRRRRRGSQRQRRGSSKQVRELLRRLQRMRTPRKHNHRREPHGGRRPLRGGRRDDKLRVPMLSNPRGDGLRRRGGEARIAWRVRNEGTCNIDDWARG